MPAYPANRSWIAWERSTDLTDNLSSQLLLCQRPLPTLLGVKYITPGRQLQGALWRAITVGVGDCASGRGGSNIEPNFNPLTSPFPLFQLSSHDPKQHPRVVYCPSSHRNSRTFRLRCYNGAAACASALLSC